MVAGSVMRMFCVENFENGGRGIKADGGGGRGAAVAGGHGRRLEGHAAGVSAYSAENDSVLTVQMNQVLSTLNRQTVELSRELATAERQMVRYAAAICYDIRGMVWWLSLHVADLSCIAMCVYEQNALYLPFQAAIYEMQSSGNSSTATAMTPAAARYTD